MRVLVLQHIACEPPGVFEDVLRERAHELVRVELDEGEPLPEGAWDAIVAMGGPMSVNDEAEHPWLVGEKAAIASHVRAGPAVLGLVPRRAAAGRRARRARLRRAGARGRRARGGADRGRPRRSGARRAARPASTRCSGTATRSTCPTEACCWPRRRPIRNQAYRVGRSAYAVQFHIEVTEAMGEEWAAVPAYAEYADRVLGPGGSDRLLAEFRVGSPLMQQHARTAFERWCDIAERRGRAFSSRAARR